MQKLLGHIGIGHVRYPTAGSSSTAEAQPFYVNSPYGLALAHNGNLTNNKEIAHELVTEHRRHVNTTSDSEVLLNHLAVQLDILSDQMSIGGEPFLNVDSFFDAVKIVNESVRGGYACVGLVNGYGLFAFRDPHGIRPLIYGKREYEEGTEWVVASESVAITALGFEVVADVQPGEAIFISTSGHLFTKQCAEKKSFTPCIFEHVYFARPDSTIDGISVYQARLNQGKRLAERLIEDWPKHDIDAVIPVPDSGRISALQMANTLGVPYREGFVKNRYVGRTFIMPGQEIRKDSVRKKLNPIPAEFNGKNVLLVDDSIVRGNTSRKIVQMSRDAGAKKVFFASAAPPVIHPNVYGIDMPAKNEYIAHDKSEEEIASVIGADWLMYQKLDDLIEACLGGSCGVHEFDTSCFNGEYVTQDIDDEYLAALEAQRNDTAKKDLKKNDEILEIHNEQ